MVDQAVIPYLKRHAHGIRKKLVLHLSGIAESAVDEKLRPLIQAHAGSGDTAVVFSLLPHQGIVDIGVAVQGSDELIVDDTLGRIKNEVHELFGRAIFGQGSETLESVIGALLMKYKRTIAVAESCTGGLLAAHLTSVSGSSAYFTCGIVSYSNIAKQQLLGVKQETLDGYGAVSEQTAVEMAEGARLRGAADYAVAITGIAGPTGGTEKKPIGLVYIGLCSPTLKEAERFMFSGSRADIRHAACMRALTLLYHHLTETLHPHRAQ